MPNDTAPPLFSDDTTASAPASSAPTPPADSPPAPTVAASTGTDAPPPASGDAPEVKRGRGRPPGSGDKRPRARKDGHAPMGESAPPVSPFADPVDGPVIEGASPQSAGAPPRPRGRAGKPGVRLANGNASVDLSGMLGMKSEELGALAVSIGSAIMVQVAGRRYGSQEAIATFAMAPDDQKTFANLTAKVIDEKGLTMTPTEALVVMLSLYYGVRIMQAEGARMQKIKAARDEHVARPVPA